MVVLAVLLADAYGTVQDGYVAQGFVFFDANGDQIRDTDEPQTQTDEEGNFRLPIAIAPFDRNKNGRLDPAEGSLVASGGRDIATGEALAIPLRAPPGTMMITPLTTLLTEVLDRDPTVTLEEAGSRLKTALKISPQVDLLGYDPFAAARTNDPLSIPVLRAAAQVQDTKAQVCALILGGANHLDVLEVARQVDAALVDRLQMAGGMDLSQPTTVEALIQRSAGNAGAMPNVVVARGAAEIIAGLNRLQEQVVGLGLTGQETVAEISRVQAFAQGRAAKELEQVGSGQLVVDDVLASTTGTALALAVAATPVGDLFGRETRPGTFAFAGPAFSVSEGGRAIVVSTVVRTDGNRGPVAVKVALRDGTATRSSGDYTGTAIEIQFRDGEIAKAVDLAGFIQNDGLLEGDETLNLELSLAPGAPLGANLGPRKEALVTIVDNDSSGTFAFASPTFEVFEDGTIGTAVVVIRTGGGGGSVSVIVTPVGIAGGATPGVDFVAEPITVTFVPGNYHRKVEVPILQDREPETNEQVTLALSLAASAPPGTQLGTWRTATLTIIDDDAPAVRPTLKSPRILANGQCQFILEGETGRTYLIEASSDLVTWAQLAVLTNLVDRTALVVDRAAPTFKLRFYRAQGTN
ncbi:MAG: hypothetical protein FJ387_26865 [Verrucomicrobia bacterium]|nr:hypothetical protein [Verrucomicrobiota bacterium]